MALRRAGRLCSTATSTALAAEWRLERAALGVGRVETLFLGGGTPSLLGPERLETLLRAFDEALTPHAEVSVETNPEDVDCRLRRLGGGPRRAQ